MKVTNNINITNTSIQQQKQQPKFTGLVDSALRAGDGALRFLDTSQAWGATAVDFGFMVLPRTATDFGRGPAAGIETARREGSGTLNHASIGLYGSLAGLLLASGINKTYGLVSKNDIKANSIFADTETINLHSQIYDKNIKLAQTDKTLDPLKSYINEVLHNYQALSPTKDAEWVTFADEQIEKATDILAQEVKKEGHKLDSEKLLQARTTLMEKLNVENNFRIIAKDGEKLHSSRYSLNDIIENVYKLGKTFSKYKVQEAFLNSADSIENQFVKSLKSMNIKRSLIGLGIGSLVGLSVQPLNMYLTKLKTGKTEFVGGGKEDKSTGFKIKKLFTAGAFGSFVMATIGHPKNLVRNLQFKGFTPTLKQFKFIYGVTIMSRFMSARNDNELKEATLKDTLGFINWLILGNFVQKLIAKSFDASLIKTDGDGIFKWIQNSVLKTRDEVLFESLGSKVFDKAGKALNYQQLVKIADKATKKKLKILTLAQIAGYAYSGAILGVGIPKLNIYLTNKRMKKQEAQKSMYSRGDMTNFMSGKNNTQMSLK